MSRTLETLLLYPPSEAAEAFVAAANFRAFLESMPDALLAIEQGGRIAFSNARAQALFGYSSSELQGKSINALMPPRLRDEQEGHMRAHLAKPNALAGALVELCGARKDGREFPVEVSMRAMPSHVGAPILWALRDVSERKKSEQALERHSRAELLESELRFRQLAENIDEVFFLVDPDLTRTFYVSPAYERIWGHSCESVYAEPKSFAAPIHPDDRERTLSVFAPERIRQGFNAEYRIVRPDGSVRWIRSRGFPIRDASGEVYRIAGIAEDVTEKRNTERELRESERRFKGMLANVELVTLMLDTEARITYCNEYMLRLTGWRLDEVLGRDFIEVFKAAEEMRGVYAQLLADAPSAWHHENEIVTRSGARRLIQWNNSVLRSASGEVTGTASIGEDITERRHAEWEVLRLNASLERRVAERTAELQAANKELATFDYSISHDLRAPLNRIRGFAGILLDDFGAGLGPEGISVVRRIDDAGKQMDQLVDDLLKLSTVTSNDLHRIDADLSGLAHSILDNLRKGAPGREVDVVVPPGLVARADAGLVRIVLENLLGNAWKFTAKRAGARIEFGHASIDGKEAYFVRDNGAGFESSKAARLFEPFRRQHRQDEFKGTGIGLATVQRIVHRHGGIAWAEGAVDRGATFYFTLVP